MQVSVACRHGKWPGLEEPSSSCEQLFILMVEAYAPMAITTARWVITMCLRPPTVYKTRPILDFESDLSIIILDNKAGLPHYYGSP